MCIGVGDTNTNNEQIQKHQSMNHDTSCIFCNEINHSIIPLIVGPENLKIFGVKHQLTQKLGRNPHGISHQNHSIKYTDFLQIIRVQSTHFSSGKGIETEMESIWFRYKFRGKSCKDIQHGISHQIHCGLSHQMHLGEKQTCKGLQR